ncbi:serine O-acetyltransferase [Nocardioides luteus]|uniref:Serine acetyltransferase n=1 Tax=Nocardioides luteus TaxID=1844 RepID=A0A1J4MXU8_9ACTN|nr:serine acetyltransferase [Nocardioides luteus]OIJ24098.1 serine acetyltransferase [Nocardioides luteus]
MLVDGARNTGDFAVDLAKMYAIVLDGPRTSWLSRLRFWLFDYELHCVAAYRFGRWATRLRARNRVLGVLALGLYWFWNRRTIRVHHADLFRRADIGPGLLLMHRSGIIVGPATIGSNCVLHQNVTIGQRIADGDLGVPTIGDDVWIGPGAVISGAITVGDGCTISAGTVLSKDVPPRSLVGGNPGRVIAKDYDNSNMINFVVPNGVGPS